MIPASRRSGIHQKPKTVRMKKITVTIDEETAHWARLEAARRGMSLSRFLREVLSSLRGEKSRYDAARRRYMRRGARPLRRSGTPLPKLRTGN